MRTYPVGMNITLSIDERLVERAREAARRRGVSLNAMIRGFLESVTGESSTKDAGEELLELMERRPGRSGGRRVRREDAYQGRA